MALALAEAELGRGRTHPNPIVGALVAGFASRLLQPADPLLEAPVEGRPGGRVSLSA